MGIKITKSSTLTDAATHFMEQPIKVAHLKMLIFPITLFGGLLWWGCITYMDNQILQAKLEILDTCQKYFDQQHSPTPNPPSKQGIKQPR